MCLFVSQLPVPLPPSIADTHGIICVEQGMSRPHKHICLSNNHNGLTHTVMLSRTIHDMRQSVASLCCKCAHM